MSIDIDVLTSTLADLTPGFSDDFTLWSPAYDAIIKRGNKETLESYQKEFVVVTKGPGRAESLTTGNEILPGGRNNIGARGNEPAPLIIYSFDVPGRDLDQASGKQDLARLIQNYPEVAMADFQEEIARQFIMGNGLGCGGFMTLNGDTTYNPNGSPRAGALDFQDPTLQTDTVFGLPKAGAVNGTIGWANQYKHISAFGFNGEQVLRDTYHLTTRQGATRNFGKCDHLFADAGSYSNYLEANYEPVRFDASTMQKGDPSKPNVREGMKFLDSVMWLEDKIIPAQFSTLAAQSGVVYGLNTATWHMFVQGKGGITGNKGFFSISKPVEIPDQYMWRFKIIFSMGMYCNSLRNNFVVTGGATT